MSLEEILTNWDKEKPRYQKYGDYITKILKGGVSELGISAKVDCRVKETNSIVKKLYKQGISLENYKNMTDKVGARVICRVEEQKKPVEDFIEKNFRVIKREEKGELLGVNEMGYRSLHFDIRLNEKNTDKIEFDQIGDITGELQLRTLCSHVWAEISHEYAYKPLSELRKDISRRIYCLGGLFEIADNQISSINKQVLESRVLDETYILNIIEPYFIKSLRSEYDNVFSYTSLKFLKTLLTFSNTEVFREKIDEFFSKNSDKIKKILNERASYRPTIPYLTQPEIIVIFYLIENNSQDLIDTWEKFAPIRDLEKLSTWWGKPISDIYESE